MTSQEKSTERHQGRHGRGGRARRRGGRARERGPPPARRGGDQGALQDGLEPAFEREYADLDWITPKGKSSQTQKFFESLGYVPQTRFNTMYGRERLLYFDEQHDRQVDVLVGTFRMSHEIPFGKRMTLEPLTVPLAELLLTKLQIIELNEKDVRDALALLHDHPVGEEDGDSVNAAHIAKLCASDWGLWRTFTANLEAPGRPPAALRPDGRRQGTHQGAHRSVAGAYRGGAEELSAGRCARR